MILIRFSEASRHPNRASSPDSMPVHVSAISWQSNLFETVNDILRILMIFLFVVAFSKKTYDPWGVLRAPGGVPGGSLGVPVGALEVQGGPWEAPCQVTGLLGRSLWHFEIIEKALVFVVF